MVKRVLKNILPVALLVGAGISIAGFMASDNRNFQLMKNIDIFNSIVRELDLFYVDTIDPNKTVKEGIDAMLYSLDPYTVYYPEDNQSELEQMLKNSYGGIGSVVSWNAKANHSMITEPYEGMPAATVGLKAGDIILEIDGQDLTGKMTDVVSDMLRGQVGTSFELKVQRPGVADPMDFTIIRRTIQLPLIPYYGKLDNNIGYINLSSFSGNPSKEFKQTFEDLKKQGITSLIIDLRNNGGGLLDEAINIANFFVPRGKELVVTKGKTGQVANIYKTLREPIDEDMPLVVLVNNRTASSSEILAGSLQDLDRAVIVGTRTYGKGLVQATRPLPYGGAIKITTSKYYIPSGRCVQAIDYEHRNEDGSVGRIPDSLTTAFHTAAGREVRDGGGIMPDVEVKEDKLPNIVYYLLRDNQIFDFATQYCLTHAEIVPAKEFRLTDADYTAFKEQVKAADFKYDQQTEKLLKNLKEVAEFEGYLDDSSEEFKALESKLTHNLDKDLDNFSSEIKKYLEEEIVKRYYYQKGAIEVQLKDDKDLNAAVEVLTHLDRYHQILTIGDTSK